jgi:hypothetical protein
MRKEFKNENEAREFIKEIKDQFYRFYYCTLDKTYVIEMGDNGCLLGWHNHICFGALYLGFSKLYN